MFYQLNFRQLSAGALLACKNNSLRLILSLAVLFVHTSISHAEEAKKTEAKNELNEIVVHTTLNNVTFDQLAASATIWQAEDITNRNAQHIDQLLVATPNVNFSGGASRGRFVQMRGIGDIEQFVDPKAYPSVGLIIDGIEFSGLFGAGLLFDVQQVEVLRGPQGTRIGASALAGVINVVSAKPTGSFSSFVEFGAGKFDAYQTSGAVSGKLTDNLRGRIALQQYRSDGYIDNQFLGRNNTGKFDEFIAKSRLDWDIGDNSTLGLTAIHLDNDNGYDAFSLNNVTNTTFSDQPGNDQQRVSAFALDSSTNLGEKSTFDAKVTYLHANLDYAYDEDWINPSFCGTDPTCLANQFSSFDQYQRDRDEYTIDFRLTMHHFIVGIYAQQRDVTLDRFYTFATNFSSSYDIERYAVYGETNADFNDRLHLSVGFRFEQFKDDYDDINGLKTSTEDDLWSLNASLSFDINDSANIYALVSRGNKAGGVNTNAISNFGFATAAAQAELTSRLRFESESLTNIELGTQLATLDNRLSIRANLFYNKRNNPQFETFLLDFPPPAGFLFIGYQDNAKSAESHGAELEINANLGKRLSLNASGSYIDSSFKKFRAYDFDQFTFVTVDEKDQPRAPKYQYHFSANLLLAEQVSVNIQYEGRDSAQYAYYFDSESGNVELTHANITYDNDTFALTFWVRNLFDETYPVQGLYFANNPNDTFSVNQLYTQSGEPRNFGMTARYNLR